MFYKIYIKFIYKIIDVNDKLSSVLRVFLYNLHPDIYIGKDVYIGSNVKISCEWGGKIIIKSKTKILKGTVILTYGNDIIIGENCSINPYCIIYGQGKTIIGNKVLIAGHTMIVPQNHSFKNTHLPIKDAGSTENGIIIEDNVWIAHGCSILDGVLIKSGSVIAAGSVLTKTTENNTVYGGIPAKIIKKY